MMPIVTPMIVLLPVDQDVGKGVLTCVEVNVDRKIVAVETGVIVEVAVRSPTRVSV